LTNSLNFPILNLYLSFISHMKKQKKATTKSAHKPTHHHKHRDPHESPIIKIGVVFIIVMGMLLFAYATSQFNASFN
jgi:hypothetical protein